MVVMQIWSKKLGRGEVFGMTESLGGRRGELQEGLLPEGQRVVLRLNIEI